MVHSKFCRKAHNLSHVHPKNLCPLTFKSPGSKFQITKYQIFVESLFLWEN